MRILMLSDGDTPHTIKWVRALAGRGHRISLFSLKHVGTDAYDDLAHVVQVASLNLPQGLVRSAEAGLRKLAYLRAIPVVKAIARTFRPDVVHAHYVSSYGLVGHLCRIRPLVVSAWGADVYTASSRSWLHRLLIQRILKGADAVLSTSYTMREQVRALAEREVIVTPFGVDTTIFSPDYSRPDQATLTIGTVKTLEPKYGIEYLLRAFALLKSMRPAVQLQLLIVGAGSLRHQLQQLSHELRIASCVLFTGRVAPDEVVGMHRNIDIGVYPSVEDSESFGVSVVEAQACAVPVIVSRVGGLPEVIEDGVTGLIVPPRNVEELAVAMRRLVDDCDLRKRMGKSGRARVRASYELSQSVQLMEQAYAHVLGRRRAESA
jgi:L-malate glycosyltransferase